jgi:hypothetical protein
VVVSVAVLSDIHGVLPALEAVLAEPGTAAPDDVRARVVKRRPLNRTHQPARPPPGAARSWSP